MDARAPFTAETEQNFDLYLNNPTHTNRQLFTSSKRAEYCYWLRNPKEKPSSEDKDLRQKQYNAKSKALSLFELRDGQLFRKAHDDKPAKYVMCSYETFECIKSTHLALGHARIVKTFKALQDRYYGITKDEVTWLVNHCQNCLVGTPFSPTIR
jgi:hypothetical protein